MKVVIVDAYSTGNQICQRLLKKDKDVDVFHIQSSSKIPELLKKSFRKSDFTQNIICNEDWDDFCKKVASLKPSHVIAGSETGVLLADRLANVLRLPGNDINLSRARRNKYFMIDAIRKANINCVWQIKGGSLDALLDQLSESRFPVVIKPLSSSSGDGFHICHSKREVSKAYHDIVGKYNILDEKNEAVLCQALLNGVQYVVNTVSYEGEHFITDVWEMQHRHQSDIPMIIDSMTLLPTQHENREMLVDYTKKVLSAIGIHFGPAHTEIMLTENGPSLIESNARLMGGNIDSCFKEVLNNYDQVDALIDSIVAPESLRKKLESDRRFENYLAEIDFVFYNDGFFKKFLKESEIRKLKSFRKFSKIPKIDTYVTKTKNTTNVEGLLYLIHGDYPQIVKDRNLVVNWQKENLLFQIRNC